MDSIKEAFVDFANIIIDEGIEDDKLAMQWMININSALKTDIIFQQLFPTIFMIELCKRKKKETDKIIIKI